MWMSAAVADCEMAAAALSHQLACLLSLSRHLSSLAFCRASGPEFDSTGADFEVSAACNEEREEGPGAPSERGTDGAATGGNGAGNFCLLRLRVREEMGGDAMDMPFSRVAGPGPGSFSFLKYGDDFLRADCLRAEAELFAFPHDFAPFSSISGLSNPPPKCVRREGTSTLRSTAFRTGMLMDYWFYEQAVGASKKR